MGSFFSRALLMVLGYAYPAYQCFKSVEKNDREIIQLLFWCHYWTIVGLLTVFEKIGDSMFSWLPLYNEAKLVFFVYLWYPKTKGTEYVYNSFLKPFLVNHETEIDENLMELKVKTRDFALFYWQKLVFHGRMRVFDVLQYVSSQSKLQTQHDQKEREQGTEPMISDNEESTESSSSTRLSRRRNSLPFISKLLGRNKGNGSKAMLTHL